MQDHGLNPCQFRHGSASHDVLTKKRTLEEIQARLRHEAPSSTKRYEKHTRYLAEVNKLPKHVKVFGEHVTEHLAELFLKRRPVPKPPGLGAALRNQQRGAGERLHRDRP